MSIEIPGEVWNDYNRLFTLFKQVNKRLEELLKIERDKAKLRKKLEREAKKNNQKRVFYGNSEVNFGALNLPK